MTTHDKILTYITAHRDEHGYAPTVREIAEAVGLRSTSTVQAHIDRMERDGVIFRTRGISRTVRVVGT